MERLTDDNYNNNEPLNLTIKKKPVAVVAPSAILDMSKSYLNKSYENETLQNNKYSESNAEDVSAKNNIFNNNTTDCLDLTKYNKNELKSNCLIKDTNANSFPHEQLKNYLEKDASDYLNKSSVYDKNIFTEEKRLYDHLKGQETKTSNIFKEAYKMSETLYESLPNNKQIPSTEGLYSMINSLAEQKFLTALYMNSLLAQNLPYGFGVNYSNTGLLEQQNMRNSQNTILNNLMDRQKLSSQLFSRDNEKNLNLNLVETIIKNEVTPPETISNNKQQSDIIDYNINANAKR